jgi:hypothetical protein
MAKCDKCDIEIGEDYVITLYNLKLCYDCDSKRLIKEDD